MVGLIALLTVRPRIQAPSKLDPNFVQVQVEDPSLKSWSAEAKSLLVLWYPKIEAMLNLPLDPHPATVYLVIDTHGDGIAGTANRRIEVNGDYVRKHPKDIGLVVHELTHVIQAYQGDGPGWLTEGIADWVRWFHYEPLSKRPHPRATSVDYHHGYQDAAAFLYWASERYNPNLVPILNQAMTLGTYSPEVWNYGTGHPLDVVWQAYLNSFKGSSQSISG